jgi:mRNA-degrading endonuclease RelE of RelBE toxin-antitoxin system
MPYEIILAQEAVDVLRNLSGRERSAVTRALERHLRNEPEKTSRSRIKRLRGIMKPQYRLRIGDVRVFYDVSGSSVAVLAVVTKAEADEWLGQFGGEE